MNLRSELSTLIQKITGETVKIYFETYYSESTERHRVSLTVHTEKWHSANYRSLEEAKKFTLESALKDVRSLKTELGVRVLLRMRLVCRNKHIVNIRNALKPLEVYFEEKGRRELKALVAQMYVIVSKLEKETQKPALCTLPAIGSVAHNRLYGFADHDPAIKAIPRMEAAMNADKKAEWFTNTVTGLTSGDTGSSAVLPQRNLSVVEEELTDEMDSE